jgi:Tfp pilus assembly protein PilN
MKNYQINLLKKKKLTLLDKIIYFFLHYLRYVVVLTQIVVIAVFFYRFKIDQEIIELKESVDEKQEIIKVTNPLVEEAQAIDFKSNQIGKIINNQTQFIADFNYILSIIPQKITLNKLEIDSSAIKLSGIATDLDAIKLLYERIKKDEKFKDVAINKLSKIDFGFEFLILIEVS